MSAVANILKGAYRFFFKQAAILKSLDELHKKIEAMDFRILKNDICTHDLVIEERLFYAAHYLGNGHNGAMKKYIIEKLVRPNPAKWESVLSIIRLTAEAIAERAADAVRYYEA